MTDKKTSNFRPFLTNYETEIPARSPVARVEYDESRMILLVNGEPAMYQSGLVALQDSKDTDSVDVETTDDE